MTTDTIENLSTEEKDNQDFKEICNKKQEFISNKKQRKIAKLGMVATMGLVTLTGFVGSKKVHTLAGFAMLGFSAWHASLYPKRHHQ